MTNGSNSIETIEVNVLNNPDEVNPHWVSHFIVPTANELLIKIKTKDGNSGFGLATSYTDIKPIISDTFDLAELANAFQHQINHKHFGKISITMS